MDNISVGEILQGGGVLAFAAIVYLELRELRRKISSKFDQLGSKIDNLADAIRSNPPPAPASPVPSFVATERSAPNGMERSG
jgi:hypothetical protein